MTELEAVSTSVITVVKADGPGWLIIAETYEAGGYRMVRDLVGDEPVTDEILRFIDRLPGRLAAIEGAEVDLKKPLESQRRLSPKRAAQQAAREVAEARDPGRMQPTKAMQLEKANFEMQKAVAQNFREIELTVWVRFGKKRAALLTETHDGHSILDLSTQAADPDSNRQAAVTLARHYATSPERVELLHGYANPQKSFRLTIPA